jgi:uncharacterized cupin superfamily protein
VPCNTSTCTRVSSITTTTIPPAIAQVSCGLVFCWGPQETAIKLFEIPPGESVCPYHYEYVEEWLLVVDGDVAVRTPHGEELARAGVLARFPSGRDGAHKLTNRAERPARVIMSPVRESPLLPSTPIATSWACGRRMTGIR